MWKFKFYLINYFGARANKILEKLIEMEVKKKITMR